MKPGTLGHYLLAVLGVVAAVCAYVLGRMLFG